jgi:hypothetical protein
MRGERGQVYPTILRDFDPHRGSQPARAPRRGEQANSIRDRRQLGGNRAGLAIFVIEREFVGGSFSVNGLNSIAPIRALH